MKDKIKVSIIIGTRPNLIKISPLLRKIKEDQSIELQFINTGQHYDYELDGIFIKELNLLEPVFLNIGSGTQGEQTGNGLIKIEKELIKFKPDISVVIGDTNSTLAGALASAKLNIPVAHIEAGLRSFDRKMPEEINRTVVDHISDMLFVPTENAIKNLKNEGILDEKIFFVQDISVDACLQNDEIAKKSEILKKLNVNNDFILVTLHRQENVDIKENLCNILDAIIEISKSREVIFPIHPRTLKNLKLFDIFENYSKKIKIIKPLGCFDFLKLLGCASCVVTDSGGIQKEALILKTPCVTTRTTTEWIETINLNANVLVGSDKEKIVEEVPKRSSKEFHKFMKKIKNPYGDGKASERIIKYIKNVWN
ncbi:MAG: UDP-N-acetylglucosamine 2-epimerase (non-hydrolyzing) [Candidatus Altarchaeum sp. CG12_big_fil_rev_8_21_14_0_65_33_22]|nr:MAG: UDP-N-acetylglucosamine 2-epimerase (non-hydrolyzing) [Candidatus Altarchaeum sp. CG12_big_fil_rev_8_21_14_0_65_33_22]PIZ32968.1 MAG: UDP-N-acetylglucosamine 2-epimerase (non-hydrolyzing) [Candidatus Altarchaeum sp. CG_4_10_14_0_8_um_filter_32_851]